MLNEQEQTLLRSYPEGALDTVRQTKDFGVPTAVAVTTGGAARMVATAFGATDETKKTVQSLTSLGLLLLKSAVDPEPPKALPRKPPPTRRVAAKSTRRGR